MSAPEYLYYKITGGLVMAAYKKFVALRSSQGEARQAIEKEFGAKGSYGSDRGLVGLIFDRPPAGWRQIKQEPTAYRPPLGKAGREITKRLASCRLDGAKKFQALVMGHDNPFLFMRGMTCLFMIYERIGKTLILCVPFIENPAVEHLERWTPPDKHCVRIKTSQYWALKEKA